jgi:hypothetical protein
MLRGDFTNLSERKLMDCLNRLGYDIEIKVQPADATCGTFDTGGCIACSYTKSHQGFFNVGLARQVGSQGVYGKKGGEKGTRPFYSQLDRRCTSH